MKLVAGMAGASVLSWLAATALVGRATGVEILLGMIGPLVVVSGTWMLTEWTYTRNPERVTSLMIAAFAAKLVFFGVYVTATISFLPVRPVPFVASFMSYFIALYFVEALSLRRLFR
jgi:uncharacterized membrane protein YeaQ/YmgE (transglycosylase-associated protein family)